MTPLAMRLAKQLVMRPKQRDPIWDRHIAMLRGWLDDVHCFEVTEILPLIDPTLDALERQKTVEQRIETVDLLMFLPAPKTWIEWFDKAAGRRIGFWLRELPIPAPPYDDWMHGLPRAEVVAVAQDGYLPLEAEGGVPLAIGELVADGGIQRIRGLMNKTVPMDIKVNADTERAILLFLNVPILLLLINSPRIIGRRQHMPHAGLEKQLTRGLGVGKFPLHAWTEIRMQVSKPAEIDDGEPHEAHLTGMRALHFVRKHIRVRRGQIEWVTAHWRGNPAIGIKRSRYKVEP